MKSLIVFLIATLSVPAFAGYKCTMVTFSGQEAVEEEGRLKVSTYEIMMQGKAALSKVESDLALEVGKKMKSSTSIPEVTGVSEQVAKAIGLGDSMEASMRKAMKEAVAQYTTAYSVGGKQVVISFVATAQKYQSRYLSYTVISYEGRKSLTAFLCRKARW